MKLFKKICLFVLALLTVFLISSNKAFALEQDQSGITDTDPYVYRSTAGNTTVVDGTANIKSIKGYTIYPNNMVQNGNFASISGWTNNQNMTFTVNNNVATLLTTELGSAIYQYISMIVGHKYLISAKMSEHLQIRLRDSVNTQNAYINYDGVPTIFTANYPFNQLRLNDIRNSDWTAETISNLMLIDLTQMFGSGNEPETVTEFNRMYPYGYIDYGSDVLNVKIDALESTGFNMWDEEWEAGGLNVGTGLPEVASRIRSKNFILVNPNTTYYFYMGGSGTNGRVLFYDEEKNYIDANSWGTNTTFNTPSNCLYIKFMANDIYGTTYNDDICINLSWSGYRNGEYESYSKYSLDLSKVMNQFPNGMSSIGEDYDELTPTKSIKRIGYAPLSTLNFTLGDDNIVSAALPADAMTDTAGYVVGNYIGNSYVENDQVRVDITGDSFDDDWEAIAEELTVYYVLDTPVETTFDAINMTYTMSDFGTEEFKVAEDYNKTAPVRHETVYADVDQQIITVESLPEATETLYLVNNIFVYLGEYYKVQKTYDEDTTSYVYSWLKLNAINNAFESSYSGYEDVNPIPLNKYRSFTINESDENELYIYFENVSYAMVEVYDKYYSSKVNQNVYILKFYEIDENHDLIFSFWTDELGSYVVNELWPNVSDATGKWFLLDGNESFNAAVDLSVTHLFNSRPYYISLYHGLTNVFTGFRSNSLVEFETVEHKTFKGWYEDSELTDKYSVDNNPTYPTENKTLYAKFNTNLYLLTIHTPSGTIYSYEEYDADITSFNNPSFTGYTFAGIFEDSTCETMVSLSTMPDHDYELWVKANPIVYTLSYYDQSNNLVHQEQYYYGQIINLYDVSNILNTDALKYQYNGWFTSSAGTTYFTSKTMPASNTSIYICEVNAGELPDNIYMITLNGMNIKYFDNIIPSDIPNGVKEGYTFVGWYYDQSLLNEAHANDVIVQNTVLYPKYTINNHTIYIYLDSDAYDDNEDPYYSKSYNYGQNISYPTPVKEGYTFAGYKIDGSSVISDAPKKMGDEDIVLIAEWIDNASYEANISDSKINFNFEDNWYIYVIGFFALVGILGLFFRKK